MKKEKSKLRCIWWCVIIIIMIMRRALRLAFSTEKSVTQRLPKAPRLLAGELQPFKLDGEAARIYDGYTLDELYGSKIGFKHSPAVKAEMRKDTIASIVLFVLGFGIIWHLHQLDLKALQELRELNDKRVSRPVQLPAGQVNTLKKAYTCDEVHY